MYYNIEGTKHSGFISYAALDGEKISHASAGRLIGAKVYYDLNKQKMIGGNGDYDSDEAITKRKYADKAFKHATSGGGSKRGRSGRSGG